MIDTDKPLEEWGRGEYLLVAGCLLWAVGMLASPSIAHALGWKWLWDATIWMLVIVLGFIPAVMGLIAMVLLPLRVLLWLYRVLSPSP